MRCPPSLRRRLALTAAAVLFVFACGDRTAAAEPPPAVPPGAIAIEADQGIEWQRRARLVIARGNAQAVRDDLQVNAQVLTAHYRERPDGSSEVWKIDAEGDVTLKRPGELAYAQRGSFDLDKDLLTLSGDSEMAVTTDTSRITAHREISYDARTRTLVARGDAVATEADRTLYGDEITIYLRERPVEGQSRMRRLEAERNVRLLTGGDDMRGERATYDVDSGKATLSGSVKIIRGTNVLTGCRAEANVTTGVSTLLACPNESRGSRRVQGVILPEAQRQP
jgi:lipopolysaccharide export system protein LptA